MPEGLIGGQQPWIVGNDDRPMENMEKTWKTKEPTYCMDIEASQASSLKDYLGFINEKLKLWTESLINLERELAFSLPFFFSSFFFWLNRGEMGWWLVTGGLVVGDGGRGLTAGSSGWLMTVTSQQKYDEKMFE